MSPLPDAAVANYEAQRRISLSTMLLARRLWARLGSGDFDEAWRTLGPLLLVVLQAGQRASVTAAVSYVPAVLDELGIDAAADGRLAQASLVGVASDGRDLASLLYEPIVATRTALGSGLDFDQALSTGQDSLDRIVSTQVADAGRSAVSVESAVRPHVTHYVRMLNLPSCPQCTILAGRVYSWKADFDRHPHCDCIAVPCDENVAGDMTTDPVEAIRSGKVHGISKADMRAILEDGADPSKVINAEVRAGKVRGAQVLGRRVKVTTEGTGLSARRRGDAMIQAVGPDGRPFLARPRPETVYKMATDRDDAIRLLRRYGYVQ